MSPELKIQEPDFAVKYHGEKHAANYARKHEANFGRRWRNTREQNLCRAAFKHIGHVKSILDCPAGAGRFWETLSTLCDELHAVEPSERMSRAGEVANPGIELVSLENCLAQDIARPDGSFDVVFCSRLLHHFDDANDRIDILTSLSRLASQYVIFSAWETNNWKHRRRLGRDQRCPERPRNRHFVPLETLKEEARQAGLEPIAVIHKLRFVSPLIFVAAKKVGVMPS